MIALYSTCVWTQCICIWLGLDNFQCYYFLCVIHFSGTFVDQDHCDETEWLPLDWKVLVIFSLLKVVLNHSEVSRFASFILTSSCLYFFFFLLFFKHQIQNADDVLITPLEKFRKEQIGAAKVRDHLRTQLATEQQRYSTRFWYSHLSSSTRSSPPQYGSPWLKEKVWHCKEKCPDQTRRGV